MRLLGKDVSVKSKPRLSELLNSNVRLNLAANFRTGNTSVLHFFASDCCWKRHLGSYNMFIDIIHIMRIRI